jgi:predicted ATP-grasp superfamily ATP-dependent carboligase
LALEQTFAAPEIREVPAMAERPPTLLCDATYYGTLAGVRSLGRAGTPVVVADSERVAPALWSRYATRRMRCPPVEEADRFVEWLLDFGRREGRHALYPTSDEVVFLQSAHKSELSTAFAMYQPELETTIRVLDKKRLLEDARAVGLDAPATWYPERVADVERAVREADGPLMLKPRTQLFLHAHRKGDRAPSDVPGLRAAFEQFERDNRFGPPISTKMPEMTRPMLQRYYPEAAECIYSLSGFRDRTGSVFAVLGAIKVLQRPRRMGVGLCFEQAPVIPELRDRTKRLLERIGYYGIFELEFVRTADKMLLIDLNARYYGQMALDVARGLDLPRLAYLATIGDDEGVARLAASPPDAAAPYAFCNRVGLTMLVGAQRLFSTMSAPEAEKWREWARPNGKIVVDSASASDDPGPFVADTMRQAYHALRHPRAFVRMIALDRD